MEKYPCGFIFFPSSSTHSSSLRFIFSFFFFVLQRYKSEDSIVRSSTQHSIVQSTRLAHPTFNRPINQIVSSFILCSSKLQIMPLQICSFFVLLQIVLPLFFFRCNLFQEQNRVFETRFCFLELESRSMWHHTSNSPSRNQVFNPRVLDWNQVYKTRDASLQNSFKRMLTYDFLFPHYTSMKITSSSEHP